jgi:hypothetical protein
MSILFADSVVLYKKTFSAVIEVVWIIYETNQKLDLDGWFYGFMMFLSTS